MGASWNRRPPPIWPGVWSSRVEPACASATSRTTGSRKTSPPGLRLDITRNEVLAFAPVSRALFHPFSDADDLGKIQLSCYALEEVMSEKIRAVLGQRIYAVSRDLYDIFSLLKHVDALKVQAGLPRKLDARAVDLEAVHLHRMTGRKDEFRADWERNLAALLPPGAE